MARCGSGAKAPPLAAHPYVASSHGSPLPHRLDRHRILVGCSAIPGARSCPGPVWYPWGSIVELEVPPDKTPGLMTLHPHNTNVLQSITHTIPTRQIQSGTKKLMLLTGVWLVLPDSTTSQWVSFMNAPLLQSFGAPITKKHAKKYSLPLVWNIVWRYIKL